MVEQLSPLFGFLALIQDNPELRARLNEVCTADEVAAIAGELGHAFEASTLVDLFERCNEAPVARSGLMDEKLIRVYLQRDALR